MSDSLWLHGLQHTRLPCPSPLLKLAQIHVQWVGDAIQPSHPLSSPSPPAFNLSQPQGLSKESVFCIRRLKYWSFSFNISPSNEYSGLFPLGWTGWISLLSKGLSRVFSNTTAQKHQLCLTLLWCSSFFIVQLSNPYMTTGKTIALTRQTFAGKVTSLLFTMLSRLVITFLPRSKRLLISWLQSPSAVILEPLK